MNVVERTVFTTCENVGEAMSDIAGLGVLISFAGQAFLSLALTIWVFFLSEMGHFDIIHQEGTEHYKRQKRRIELFSELLIVGNDFQVLLGIAYMVTAYIKRSTIGLYHLRLVFDTVSFVGVSSTAALVCFSFCHTKLNKRLSRLSFRYLSVYFYAIFFVSLSIVLLIHLGRWNFDPEFSGHCYNTKGISLPIAGHPASDQLYVGLTSLWLLAAILVAVFVGPRGRTTLLVLASLQYPVHLYFMIAVRYVNQPLLEGPEKEDHWDFGQTSAILLMLLAYAEVAKKMISYQKFRKESDKKIAASNLKNKLENDDIAMVGI